MTVYRMDVIIEAKDGATIDGVQPHHPDPLSAAVAIQDTMTDLTKHDHRLGWRITQVRPAQAGTAVISAADLRHLLNRVEDGRWLMYTPYAETIQALRQQLNTSRAGRTHNQETGAET